MNPQRILITGGAGFVGRWVVERCLREGMKVAVYDNLCAGRLDNIVEFMDRIDFCEADILDVPTLSSVMEEFQPTTVFHLAAHHFIPFCNAHPEETLRVNVEGTFAVLNQAARHGVKVAVTTSTGGIYPSLAVPLQEDTTPVPPDIYGLSKFLTEHAIEHVSRTTQLRCVAVRLFNVYGPYETNPHLIPHIIESLRRGPVVELGNTSSKRDYIYTEDVARLLLACAQAARDPFTVVNLGTGAEHSVMDVIAELEQLTGQRIQVKIDEARLRPVDKMFQRADTARLKALTGRLPQYSLRQGLEKLLQHERLLIS